MPTLYSFVKYGGIAAFYSIIVHLLLASEFNKFDHNHRPGPCQTVIGPKYGSEDIELIKELNIAFISSGIYYMVKRSPETKGDIFLYDFSQNSSRPKAEPLKIMGNFDKSQFHPHGLSSFYQGGKLKLYVINHDDQFRHSVVVFEFDQNERFLKYHKTITDEKMIRPNDLKVIGDDKFIFTNCGSAQNIYWSILLDILHFKTGSVVYYDGKKSYYLLDSSLSPNGIAVDHSLQHLFIASPLARSIVVYKLPQDLSSGQLPNKTSEIPLHSSPDNIFLDNNSVLWIGAHSVGYKILRQMLLPDDPQVTAPSQKAILHQNQGMRIVFLLEILQVQFQDGFENWTLKEVYFNDGSEIVASPIGVPHGNLILIGSIGRTLIACENLYF